jgi:site-specific DNA-methyltransferase (adenine-specific)
MRDTLDVWDIRPESAKRVGHPAPFPVELPARLIGLYTFLGDLVMDPFMGAGTTLVAAHLDGRRGIGFDTSPAYVELARNRLAALPEVPEKIGAGAQDEVPDAEAASLPVDPP